MIEGEYMERVDGNVLFSTNAMCRTNTDHFPSHVESTPIDDRSPKSKTH